MQVMRQGMLPATFCYFARIARIDLLLACRSLELHRLPYKRSTEAALPENWLNDQCKLQPGMAHNIIEQPCTGHNMPAFASARQARGGAKQPDRFEKRQRAKHLASSSQLA